MFYKRISDLHPLGQKQGSSWDNVTPIEIPNAGKVIKVNTGDAQIQSANVGSQTTPWRNVNSQNKWPLKGTSFADAIWNNINKVNDTFASASTTYVDEAPEITSEYYNKALWFEVAVSKDVNNAPTSKRTEIDKYHSKRLNAYLLFTNIEELHASIGRISCLSATNITASEISTKVLSATNIRTSDISAKYGEISVVHSDQISCKEISVDNGKIDHLSGDALYYDSGWIQNISAGDISCTNITVKNDAILTAMAAYWADLAELYDSDEKYSCGTLVKFGGEKEITIANDKANAVVSEKPAITMNSGLNKNSPTALPIVLAGRSRVRVLQPIKKFEKICLSTVPGVAVGENIDDKFKASKTPLGIALESSDKPSEKMVECVLQLNLE